MDGGMYFRKEAGIMDRRQWKGWQQNQQGVYIAFVMALCSVAASCVMAFAACAAAESSAAGVTVEYENLSQLVQEGNLSLRQVIDDYESNKQNYQDLLDTLRKEQATMKFLAEQQEEDEEASALYSSNASALASSARQISNRIESLNRKSSTRSVETSIDNYTQMAQTQMNSYNQMALNLAAQEKKTEAAQAAYQAAVAQNTAGLVTAAEVLAAADSLAQAKNSLSSYQQQEEQLRFNLLSLLGLETAENVTIGAIPEPDLTAIDAIDIETEKWNAVNNSSTVQNARHANAGTTTEIQQRFSNVAEAEGTAEADILACYQSLLASKGEYLAALDSFESASLTWQGVVRKRQAGLVDSTDYLEGEASYLAAKAAKETASMNLYQAYETYRWEVKGGS